MKLVRPISEEKRRELEKELEIQKQRFLEATQRSSDILAQTTSLVNWVKRHPIELAAVMFAAGFIGVQYLDLSNRQNSSLTNPDLSNS